MFCPHCGKEVFNDAVVCIGCGRSLAPLKSLPTNLEMGAQKLRDVARTFLVIGILNLIVGIFVTIVGWFLGIFSVLLGIWEIENAYLYWSTPPKSNRNRSYIAVLEIINVICGPVWSLFAGISNLKRLRSPEVEAYFANLEIHKPQVQRQPGRLHLVFGWILAVVSGLFLIVVPLVYFLPAPESVRKSTQMPLGAMITCVIIFGFLLLLAILIIRKANKLRRLTSGSS